MLRKYLLIMPIVVLLLGFGSFATNATFVWHSVVQGNTWDTLVQGKVEAWTFTRVDPTFGNYGIVPPDWLWTTLQKHSPNAGTGGYTCTMSGGWCANCTTTFRYSKSGPQAGEWLTTQHAYDAPSNDGDYPAFYSAYQYPLAASRKYFRFQDAGGLCYNPVP